MVIKMTKKNKELQKHLDMLDDITSQLLIYVDEEHGSNADERASYIEAVNTLKDRASKDIKFCKKHYFLSNLYVLLAPISTFATIEEGIAFGKTLSKKHFVFSFLLGILSIAFATNIGYEDAQATIVESDLEEDISGIISNVRKAFNNIKWAKEPDL